LLDRLSKEQLDPLLARLSGQWFDRLSSLQLSRQLSRLFAPLLDSLLAGQTRAKAILARAAELDMDVADGERALEETRENVIESRTAVHAFTVDHLKDVTKNGFAAEAKAESLATAAIFEYKFRRAGFGVATLILTGLALLIWLKLRRIERKRKAAA